MDYQVSAEMWFIQLHFLNKKNRQREKTFAPLRLRTLPLKNGIQTKNIQSLSTNGSGSN